MKTRFSKQNSLQRSIVTTVTCWKIVISFTNFLLKFLRWLLKHNHFTRSCRCGAHSEIMFVWLFFFMKLTKWLSLFWVLFLPTTLEYPQKINIPFFRQIYKITISCSSYRTNANTWFHKPTDHNLLSKDIIMYFSYTASCTTVATPKIWVTFMLLSTNCVYRTHTFLFFIIVPC